MTGCTITSIYVTLKMISYHALHHLERHFVCVVQIKWRKVNGFFLVSLVKRIQNDV